MEANFAYDATLALGSTNNQVASRAITLDIYRDLKIGQFAYTTRNEARSDVFDYINRFYNPRRRHSTLGQVSPDQFEEDWKSLG